MISPSPILDQYGKQSFQNTNGHRVDMSVLNDSRRLPWLQRRELKASYDAAAETDDLKNYWANADSYDADSANSKAVRDKIVARSRYEVANNGYADGMVQTHANYLVGTGPQLRMQTRSKGFNELVESQWRLWAKAIHLRRKLWCQAHAKVQDGEGFGVAATKLTVNHPVKLFYTIFETEQCQTPLLPFDDPLRIDGVHLDKFNDPIAYDILTTHPGSTRSDQTVTETIDARFVMHWFKLRRPGQHRAVPEFRSTLNVGGTSRRHREATVAAAETAADISALMHTQLPPDAEADPVAALSSIEFEKRMMLALPMGWDAMQMKGEHPNATYKDFHRLQINEQGRPKSMPVNVGMADSSEHNFASGKLDHLSWFQEMIVEREDGADLVLDPLFDLWFEEAVPVLGFVWDINLFGIPPHTWDWPVLPVADEKARALARGTDLENGSTTLSAVYAEQGKDFEDEVQIMAADYGVTVEELRAVLLAKNLADFSVIESDGSGKLKIGSGAKDTKSSSEDDEDGE